MRTPFSTIFTLAGFILFIGGCSSGIRVSQDYEPATVFSSLKTYTLKSTTRETIENGHVYNPLIDERIHVALVEALSEKGYSPVVANPDFLVNYQYLIRMKIASESSGSSIGVGLGTHNMGSSLLFGTGNGISQFDEGRLVIDFKQGDTGKLIWRGTSTFRAEEQVEPGKLTEKINLAVKKNLDQFPPKRE